MGRKDKSIGVNYELENAYAALLATDFYGETDTAQVAKNLADDLSITTKKASQIISELIANESLIYSKKQGRLINGVTTLKGVFHPAKGRDKGFVTVDGFTNDIKVKGTKFAREGDIVTISYKGEEMPETVSISDITTRVNDHVTGVVMQNEYGQYILRSILEPNPQDYYISSDKNLSYYDGQICSMKIDIFASKKGNGSGRIEKSFGYLADQDAYVNAIFEAHGFPEEFPPDVLAEVKNIPDHVLEEEYKGRLDLRHLPIISCDPKGCRDKDDAYYIEKTENGYRAYVAIADVEHYVKPGSAIDREAQRRSTSCYVGKYVRPMLPPELSNGICSLHAGVDRLAVVKIIDLDLSGEVTHYDIKQAVINCVDAITYEQQEDIYLNHEEAEKVYSNIKPMIDDLYAAHRLLSRKMKNNGKIDIDIPEPHYVFDSNNNVIDVIPQGTEESHAVVESFMVTSNRIMAQYGASHGLTMIYRNHSEPTKEKINFLNQDLKSFGISLTSDGSAHSFQKILNSTEVQNSKFNSIIQTRVLRAQQKAGHDIENLGHFALGVFAGSGPASVHLGAKLKSSDSEYQPIGSQYLSLASGYAHGTSPIRRYDDLENQRTIISYINGEPILSDNVKEDLASYITRQSRAADSASAEGNRYFNAKYASRNIGAVYEGYIKDMYSKALIVSIKDGLVDVTIPTAELKGDGDAFYKVSDDHMRLVDIKTGRVVYSLADTIPVKISSVDFACNEIFATTDLSQKQERPQDSLPSAKDLPSISDVEKGIDKTVLNQYEIMSEISAEEQSESCADVRPQEEVSANNAKQDKNAPEQAAGGQIK